MNQNLKQFIYGAILLGGGLYLGRMIGQAEVLKNTSGMLVNSHFTGASTNLNSHIKLLELLHANDYKNLSAKLEVLVDIDLIALSQYVPPHPYKDEIIKSIEKAKQYRDKNPVEGRSPEVTGAIRKAYDLVK